MKYVQPFIGFYILSVFCFSCNTPQDVTSSILTAYQEDFDTPASLSGFEFSDADSWNYNPYGALECFAKANYEPPYRSPLAIALISQKSFGSFILEADLQQTGEEYNHQDMCVIFGFQNPSQFYYTHISRMMDEHANQVFIVDNAARIKISTNTNPGQDWEKDKWHHIRLIRNLESGSIQLFFDDMDQPVMEAKDNTFGPGMIGFGSFDDTGMIDNIRIWSDEVSQEEEHFFELK